MLERKGVKKYLTATEDKESKEEGLAQSIILDSLNTEDQYLVSECETAKDMIEKLEKRYKQSVNIYTVTKSGGTELAGIDERRAVH